MTGEAVYIQFLGCFQGQTLLQLITAVIALLVHSIIKVAVKTPSNEEFPFNFTKTERLVFVLSEIRYITYLRHHLLYWSLAARDNSQ